MQVVAGAAEKPPAQEQWRTMENTMEKTMRRAIGTVGNPDELLASWTIPETPQKIIARRREAPGADFRH